MFPESHHSRKFYKELLHPTRKIIQNNLFFTKRKNHIGNHLRCVYVPRWSSSPGVTDGTTEPLSVSGLSNEANTV